MRRKQITPTTVLIVLQLCSALSTTVTAEGEGEARWQSHFPDDAELFLPEPVPEPDETMELMVNAPAGQLARYDMLTGEKTMLLGIDPEDIPPAVWMPGNEGVEPQTPEDPFNPMNFSGLSWIAHPEDWPWSPNCKIFYTRRGIGYVASGVLIDAYHVLTAGHVLHEGSGGIWSSAIVVVPAYQGGMCPYGDAQGVACMSWEAWTLYGDPKHDMGVIRLDRPIGALTGWYGYGWTSDMSFYLGTTFHNAGYPAEVPYGGQYMYYWGGTFDSMDYPWLVVNRRGVGGQAGSGAHWIDAAGHRYAYAVFSSRSSRRTYFPMITGEMFPHMENFISEITPSRLDLLALGVQVRPGAICVGDRLDSMSYVVYNHSSASWSGRVYVNVYLSTNDYISTLDILIDRRYFTHSFGPKDVVPITVSTPPTIPSGIAGGEYWIGVMLDISDNDTSNNYSHGQEAARIEAVE